MASLADEDNFDIDIYGDGEEFNNEDAGDKVATTGRIDDAGDITIPDDSNDVGDITVPDVTNQAGNVANPQTANAGGNDANGAQQVMPQAKADEPVPRGQDAPQIANQDVGGNNVSQRIASTAEGSHRAVEIPKQPPQKQGTKRKGGPDGRPIDPGATNAILISDLNWWNTDDDIRGWVNQTGCEDELKDVTFSEHKVNGKSKSQAFVEFTSPQAATAAKQKIESYGKGQQYVKRHTVMYTSTPNPFRTLPKDAPPRGKEGHRPDNRAASGGFSGSGGNSSGSPGAGQMNSGVNSSSGGFRGGRGGFNNRGMPANNMGGFQNRSPSVSSPMGGPPQGGFQAGGMGGYGAGPAGGMQQYNAYNRGGMMGGMRGGPPNRGRGLMTPHGMMSGMPGMSMGGMGAMGGMMGGMPGMGGMGAMGGMMGGMPPQMSAPNMMGQMGMQGPGGFTAPQPHFNPAFFPQTPSLGQNQGSGGDGNWNPHGTKRQRPE